MLGLSWRKLRHGRGGGGAEQGGLCRCEPGDKRQSLGNRIMASCLNLNCLSGYSRFERGRVYLRIWRRENAKTRTTKRLSAVYWDGDVATATVTAAPDLQEAEGLNRKLSGIWGEC